jgi:tetratricopeptide (TPR) repeat protein
MRTHSRTVLLAAVLAIAGLGASSCSKIGMLKGQMAWKDANAAYAASDYKKAIEKYQEALKNNPELSYAYFYLGNSYDNLYKVAKKGQPENDANLQKAVENYKLATEKITEPKLRKLSFEYLLNSYGPDKLNDPSQAEPSPRSTRTPATTSRRKRRCSRRAMPIRRTRPSTCRWRPSTTARDASTRRWMR